MHESVDSLTQRVGAVVRGERLARGWTLGELARRAGLSKSALSRLEGGSGNPSIETLFRLAGALGLPLSGLLVQFRPPRVHVVRARSTEAVRSDDGLTAWLVHARQQAHRSELFELDLPEELHESEPHLRGTEEIVVCVEGTLRAGPLDGEAELHPGDAVIFEADVPHLYAGPGRALNWILYPA